MKNPPEFYNEKYLKSPMCVGVEGEGTRWDDNGAFFTAAHLVHEVLQSYKLDSVLDVGCGRGWLVNHLRNIGHKAEGCEYGYEAVENSVCGAVWADLTEKLPYEDNSFDVVTCFGVLSHLPAENVATALSELRRITKNVLITNILVMLSSEQWHHITVFPKEWWTPKFKKAGWKRNTKLSNTLDKQFGHISVSQWFSVFEKVI